MPLLRCKTPTEVIQKNQGMGMSAANNDSMWKTSTAMMFYVQGVLCSTIPSLMVWMGPWHGWSEIMRGIRVRLAKSNHEESTTSTRI